jgi:threonine dehydrogenase-like Zn-dependent dehydrogenase
VRVTRSQVSAGTEMNGLRALEAAGTGEKTSGYTTVGRVLAVGPDVTELAPGDRVLCYGHHASHCVINVGDGSGWRAVPDKLPDDVTDEQACFAVLGDVALHGIRRAGLQIDESVAVFGAGVVGQLTIQFARLSGAHPIVVVDLDEARLALARRHGATHTVNARAGDAAAAVRAITNGGAGAVFHCSANPSILQTTLEAAGDRGTVVLTGSAPGTAEIGLQVELLRHELTILGNYETGLEAPHPYWPWTRQRNRFACYRLMASGDLQVATLMSHTVPPERAQEMYRLMAAGPGDWMAITFVRTIADISWHRRGNRGSPLAF